MRSVVRLSEQGTHWSWDQKAKEKPSVQTGSYEIRTNVSSNESTLLVSFFATNPRHQTQQVRGPLFRRGSQPWNSGKAGAERGTERHREEQRDSTGEEREKRDSALLKPSGRKGIEGSGIGRCGCTRTPWINASGDCWGTWFESEGHYTCSGQYPLTCQGLGIHHGAG